MPFIIAISQKLKKVSKFQMIFRLLYSNSIAYFRILAYMF